MKLEPRVLNWSRLTLPGQFILAGAMVMVVATLIIGSWVTARIEQAVVQNSAISAALLIESFVAPLSQDLAAYDALSEPAKQALKEIFEGTKIGEQVAAYKIWKADGLIVHASDASLIGLTFEPTEELKQAWSGQVAASFEDLDDAENASEAALRVPLLEVYSPIREIWTGEIIGVAEFYQRADALVNELADARRKSWLVVSSAFLLSGLLLLGIVQAGGKTIREQRRELEDQLGRTEAMSRQNYELRQRVVFASSRATAQTERTIRRIGFDLHDGAAQYVALAALRLDSALGAAKDSPEAAGVRQSLDKALDELRIVSRGLALPDLDTLDIGALVERAIVDHEKQTEMHIDYVAVDRVYPTLSYAQKLCIYRFLQETLSNVARHAAVSTATVRLKFDASSIAVNVTDAGVGFDPAVALKVRTDGGQGLLGLIDRAESIGGSLSIVAAPKSGTKLSLTLPLEEEVK